MQARCPHCHVETTPAGACPECRGFFLTRETLDTLAPKGAAWLRRHMGRGPPTQLRCTRCRGALKAFDVPGFQHEGDLFWGLESPRPQASSVAEGCPGCGSIYVDYPNLAAAGGVSAWKAHLVELIGSHE